MSQNSIEDFNPGAFKAYINKRMSAKMKDLDLTPSNARFLRVINVNDGISLKEISAIMIVDKALTTRTVKQLIKSGYIENRSGTREYCVSITEKGRTAVRDISADIKSIHDEMLSCLTDDEKKELVRLLTKIYAKVSEGA